MDVESEGAAVNASDHHLPTAELPTVVIGAGPVGLAAAAHLVGRGLRPLVLEAGAAAG
ncbi:NAD(P)-binding protein, partial [Streptomyces sp. NPDC005904]|uniref:NAD(P)-binding protein n=1 Tax=Streptomyces sp. NPDC005904 TaxID=3154570 RepID=UPI0033F53162